MRVSSISLDGFRNYEELQVEFSPNMNLICGENAQGKTNLLEAIGFLSAAKSHRTRSDRDLISFDRQTARILASVESRERHFTIEINLSRTARRKLFVNHVKLKNAASLSDVLHSVLFCPEDLSLIRAGAVERRRFLDTSICQLRPQYEAALSQYHRLLEHKTRILRDWGSKPALLDVLEEFNDAMARTGAIIVHYRAHFLRRLSSVAGEIQQEFSSGREQMSLHYQTVSTVLNPFLSPAKLYEQLLEHQRSHTRAELDARSCLSGPHKDDFITELNGKNARQFASQGQTRTAALSLKLAERELHRDDTGQWPILLLDDVLSELDSHRQDFVLRRITGGQVFITSCERPPLLEKIHMFHIEGGKLSCQP